MKIYYSIERLLYLLFRGGRYKKLPNKRQHELYKKGNESKSNKQAKKFDKAWVKSENKKVKKRAKPLSVQVKNYESEIKAIKVYKDLTDDEKEAKQEIALEAHKIERKKELSTEIVDLEVHAIEADHLAKDLEAQISQLSRRSKPPIAPNYMDWKVISFIAVMVMMIGDYFLISPLFEVHKMKDVYVMPVSILISALLGVTATLGGRFIADKNWLLAVFATFIGLGLMFYVFVYIRMGQSFSAPEIQEAQTVPFIKMAGLEDEESAFEEVSAMKLEVLYGLLTCVLFGLTFLFSYYRQLRAQHFHLKKLLSHALSEARSINLKLSDRRKDKKNLPKKVKNNVALNVETIDDENAKRLSELKKLKKVIQNEIAMIKLDADRIIIAGSNLIKDGWRNSPWNKRKFKK